MSKNRSVSSLSILILIVVIIASTIGVLTLVSAKADLNLAYKQTSLLQGQINCSNQAQKWLSTLNLSEEGEISRQFNDGDGHQLSVSVTIMNNEYTVSQWVFSTDWKENTDINVWGK